MVKRTSSNLLCCLYFLAVAYGLAFSNQEQIYVPEQLQPWKNWVLQKHPHINCPDNPIEKVKQCVWPSKLEMQISESGAHFSFEVQSFSDDMIAIPGDSVFWPCDVTVNGTPAAVFRKNGIPITTLSSGNYKISGNLKWEHRPNSIKVPDGTALISVQIDGKESFEGNVDRNGMLWLKEENASITEDSLAANNVEVKVYRKVIDAIPLYIVTVMKLIVSGQDRELLLGRFLPEGAVPVYVHSEIPTRIEQDGNVRVQVKNGTWLIEMKCRLSSNNAILKMEQRSKEWPQQEVWALQADPHLRSISVKGVNAIDPGQTGIPEDWKQLPVYLVTSMNNFQIVEEQRGDFLPEPNSLKLNREMWLDFKGKGFTIKDQIEGTVSRSGRLSMDSGYTLGSVTLNEVPQIVTTVGQDIPGIEYRQGNLQLECLSRIEKVGINALGWNTSFTGVVSELHLPPGWSIFHISGSDYVHDSWISKWTVWDLFLMLILVVSIYRIYNVKWGLIALLTFAITFHEKGAPLFLWLNLVAGIALMKVLHKGRLKQVLTFYTLISLLVITFIGAGFAIVQVRQALYPQLEYQTMLNNSERIPDEAKKLTENVSTKSEVQMSTYLNLRSAAQNLDQYDAVAKIQTGPGEPLWRWTSVKYGWSGPVEKAQKIHIFLIPPIVNRVIKVLRVILLFVLLFGICGILLKGERISNLYTRLLKKTNLLMLAIFLFLLFPSYSKADFPSRDILDELEKRLVEKSTCGAECYSVQQGKIDVDNNNVTIQLLIDAADDIAVQLPGNRTGWFANKVTVNGQDDAALKGTEDNGLIAVIPKGHTTVILTGKISGNRCEIQFPLNVNNMTFSSDQWLVNGIVNGKIPGGFLRLDKKEKSSTAVLTQTIASDQSLPFVEVSRKIMLDKEWDIMTTVKRISPESDPLTVRIPLLPNESVISSVISDPMGVVTVYMNKDQQEFSWHSTLKITDEIDLEIPFQDKWVEVWSLDHSPRWHVETSGLSQIKQNAGDQSLQMWCPLPGEKIKIKVQRPEAISGPTMTIKEISMDYQPGRKTSETRMTLSVLSSQADRLNLKFPVQSHLGNLTIDGISQIVTFNHDIVSIPVHPGLQRVELEWKGNDKTGFLTKTPRVECGMKNSNTNITCNVPSDRWVLFAGGPMVGPALLFWAILIVLLLISIALGKLKFLPLQWYHWFLLSAGMSTVDNVGGILIVLWFICFAMRAKITMENRYFNYWQIGCVLLTLAAIGSLIATIPLGLLNTPDMQITGNGSSSHFFKWYQDISTNSIPQGWFISLPIWVYRTLMLAWSLWIALCLTRWINWGWQAFSSSGLWKIKAKKIMTKV